MCILLGSFGCWGDGNLDNMPNTAGMSSGSQPQHIGLLLRQNGTRSARRKVLKHHFSQQALRIPRTSREDVGSKGPLK